MTNGITAEQVREAWCSNLKRDCLYDPPSPDWQAIADELNAALGVGECELAYGENDDGVDGWYTSCGGWFAATREDRRLVHPVFCQLCGGKAVER